MKNCWNVQESFKIKYTYYTYNNYTYNKDLAKKQKCMEKTVLNYLKI